MRDEQFSLYKITNAHAKFKDDEQSVKLGCVGELTVDSEVQTIEKKCEGIVVETAVQVIGQTMKFVGHINKSVLNKLFGIDAEGMKPGVRVYSKNSKSGNCCLTFDTFDLFQTDVLMLAFPNCTVNTGYKIGIKNGESEVAEIEVEFKVSADEKGGFMYEAFKSEASDVVENWHTNFVPADKYLEI